MEEQVLNMFDAKHVKGKQVEFEFELTSIMLSRALFANSCSINVDVWQGSTPTMPMFVGFRDMEC
jgi:hypothetical protein